MSVIIIALGLLMLFFIGLQRAYSDVSLKELKHRARKGDNIAAAFIKVVSFGPSLRALLWILVGFSAASFFVVVGQQVSTLAAVFLSAFIVWIGFIWLPAAKVSAANKKVAAWVAPVINKVLQFADPIIGRLIRLVRRHKPVHFHTGLYDRFDLVDLLERQIVQADNRIEKTELEIAKHALLFGDSLIGEVMTPRRQVKMVSMHDSLGPILVDELHSSGHSRFPVFDGKHDNIVGTLFLYDMVRLKNRGTVKSLMRREAHYLHEDQSLHDALQAVLKTHRHLFIVVNKFEEYVGIITSEDVLEAIVGNPIIDEFDNYEDLRAVAKREAVVEHKDHEEEIKQAQNQVAEEMKAAEENVVAESAPDSENSKQDEVDELEEPKPKPKSKPKKKEDIETVEIDNTK